MYIVRNSTVHSEHKYGCYSYVAYRRLETDTLASRLAHSSIDCALRIASLCSALLVLTLLVLLGAPCSPAPRGTAALASLHSYSYVFSPLLFTSLLGNSIHCVYEHRDAARRGRLCWKGRGPPRGRARPLGPGLRRVSPSVCCFVWAPVRTAGLKA